MAQMGRPPIENPKGHTVSFRMNEEQFARLKEYSSRYDVTLTQVIQDAVDSYLDSDTHPGSVSSFPASERSNNGGKKRQQGKSVKKGGNLSKK
jgi:predicted DNA-binding protein